MKTLALSARLLRPKSALFIVFFMMMILALPAQARWFRNDFDVLTEPEATPLVKKVAEAADEAGTSKPEERKVLRERELNPKTLDPGFLANSLIQSQTGNSFFSAIYLAVDLGLKPRKIFTNSAIDEAYGLPGRAKSLPVSLISHPICHQTPASLSHILGSNFVPDADTISKINVFGDLVNRYREESRAHIYLAREKFTLLWSSFFTCLAYAESLTDSDDDPEFDAGYADFLNSNSALKRDFISHGLEKRPPGVAFAIDHPGEFYIRKRAILNDPNLSETEKAEALAKLEKEFSEWGPKKWLVAGLYQFSPNPNGNVVPCLEQWNDMLPEYDRQADTIERNLSGISRALLSPVQSFNAYCGAQKLVQGINSQVNTKNFTGVHPDNILSGKKLKDPKERCVSLMMRGGTGHMYAHFGPLRNSTQKNLAPLFRCIDKALIDELRN